MKKILSLTSLVLVFAMLAMSLVSCAPTISGTYYSGDKKLTKTYVEMEFSGSKVTITDYVVGSSIYEVEASYSIDGDKITIELPEDANELAKEVYDGEYSFEQGEDYIKIGVVEYKLDK